MLGKHSVNILQLNINNLKIWWIRTVPCFTSASAKQTKKKHWNSGKDENNQKNT